MPTLDNDEITTWLREYEEERRGCGEDESVIMTELAHRAAVMLRKIKSAEIEAAEKAGVLAGRKAMFCRHPVGAVVPCYGGSQCSACGLHFPGFTPMF